MKKITILMFFLITHLFVKAQVTETYVPNIYNIENNSGASIPFYQKDGFIYCISSDLNGNGKIFKINQITNSITEIQNVGAFNYGYPKYIGEYNDKLVFKIGSNLYEFCFINTSDNTLTIINSNSLSKNIFQNYLIGGEEKINIDNGTVSNIGITNAEYNNQPINISTTETNIIINNSYYTLHEEYLPYTNYIYSNKIFKLTNNGNDLDYNLQYIAPSNSTIHGLHNGLYNNDLDFFEINNKIMFFENLHSSTFPLYSFLKSYDINNNQVNTLLTLSSTSSFDAFYKCFIYNNELYFYSFHTPSLIRKTDGIIVDNSNLTDADKYNFFNTSWYLPNTNFIEYQGFMYSLKNINPSSFNRNFIRFDGVNSTTISTNFYKVDAAIIHNNIMYFSGLYYNNILFDGIFSFDGIEFKKLDLGLASESVANNTSLYAYNNYLFFGNGQSLIKVNLNTVNTVNTSTLNIISNESANSEFILQPNPIKNKFAIQNISNSIESFSYEIYSMEGKILKFGKSNFNDTLDIENFSNGVYIIQIKTENEKKAIFKIIKK